MTLSNKIDRLIEETFKRGTSREKGKGFLSHMKRNAAALNLKTMAKDRDRLRKSGDHTNANFYDNERRAYSAGLNKNSPEAKYNKRKVGVGFDGHNLKKSLEIEGSKPRVLRSAKN